MSKTYYQSIVLYLLILCGATVSVAQESAVELKEAGTYLYQQGRYEEAIDHWRQALKQLPSPASSSAQVRDPQDLELRISLQRRLAYALQQIGFDEQAYQALQSALTVAEENAALLSTSAQVSRLLGQLGEMLLHDERWREAGQYLSESVEQARKLDDQDTLVWALNNLGHALTLAGGYEQALEAYREGLARIKTVDNKALQSQLWSNLLRLHLQLAADDPVPQWQAAYSVLQWAVNATQEQEPTQEQIDGLITLALLAKELRQHPALPRVVTQPYSRGLGEALITLQDTLLRQALELATTLRSTHHQAYAHGYLGQFAEEQQNYSLALEHTRQALWLAFQTNNPASIYLWQWQLGRIYRAQGQIDPAITAYRQAVTTLNPIRSELINSQSQDASIFRERIQPVYFGLADLLLTQEQQLAGTATKDRQRAQASAATAALVASADHNGLQLLREARNIVETLKAAELQDYFQDECTVALQEKQTQLDTVDPHSALIYPIVLPERLVLLLSINGQIQQVVVPVAAATVKATVQRFRRHLQTRSTYQYLRESRQLYDWLIRPLEPHLVDSAVHTLVLVPDSTLNSIPFATLQDGESFVVERYAVAVTPSLSLTDPRPFWREGDLSVKERAVLIAGLSEGVQDFSPLPSVPRELRTVQSLIGGDILEDKAYSLENLSQALTANEYAIVHMATHGVFGGSDENNFLLTHDEKLTMSELGSLLREGIFRTQPLELLTLSACQTALGDERSALGLAGVAIQSGARSASASLWFVDDEATAEVITGFYRQWVVDKLTRARALQRAQLDLLQQKRYRHPIYWGPYLLIGNWL